MKTKNIIFLSILMALCLRTYAQEPFDVNGYLIIENNGEYYNIVGSDTLKIVHNSVILRYTEDATLEQINTLEQLYDLSKRFHTPTDWISYSTDGIIDIVYLVESLTQHTIISAVLFNRIIPYCADPDESVWVPRNYQYPNFGDQFCDFGNLPYNVSHLLMEIDLAWNYVTGSNDVIIAFIDSGIDINNADLGPGNDGYHNLWEHPQMTGIHGWNFVDNNSNIEDNIKSHGTLVASIASAKTNNNTGTFGVAGGWNDEGARIMTLKAGLADGVYEDAACEALYYAIQNGARIVNMSFGHHNWYFQPLDEAINIAVEDYNCLIFASVGNFKDDPVSWPASHPKVNAVGASIAECPSGQFEEKRWTFAQTQGSAAGPELDFVAACYAYTCHVVNGYHWWNETVKTSGAAAYSSGIAALILSANPMLTNLEVADIMRNTADKIDVANGNYQNGHSEIYGYGRLNAHQAVLEALDAEGEPYIEITGTITWDLPRRQAGDVVVMPGAELTLTSTLYMQPETRIIVRRGGKLVIDGGSVTSVGTGLRWRGIEVWGNSAQPQQVVYQGWVRIINEGSVKNSVMGIYTNRPDHAEEGRWEPGYTGGIVQGIDARFVNNKTALQFYPYNYPSVSGFTNCEFITYGYEAGVDESAFLVEITGINGIGFLACHFENKCDAVEFYRSGIHCVNSYVNVHGKCKDASEPCDDWDQSTFTGLHYGIHASAITSTYYIDVRNTEFNNNRRSLYLSGISNARITSNEFIINTPFKEDGGYALYLDECTGYWVEDNEFRHDVSSRKGIGVIVNNSGTDPNEIYRNRFRNLEQGISAQGNNKDPKSATGLQILCNDFVDCDADILVVNPSESRGIGIAAHQGANSQNPQHMAGNLFHHHTAIDFNDINNEGEDIIYYYPLQNTDDRVKPEEITGNTVNPVSIPFSPPWDYVDGCPCRLESGGGGHEEELKQQMAESGQQADDLQESLDMLIDDGDSESLFWDVYMSTSPEAMQVYQELMNTSPYLSDTVVSAAIIKEDVLVD
ncbi:MAG: S8 family serine peptidase, partial [Bacteroidales bacterium]